MQTVSTLSALLVDDEVTSRAANLRRIEGDGYSVVVAADAAAALANAKRSAPNVIFIHMTGGRAGSLPLIEALRKDDACRHIRIVVLPDGPAQGRSDGKLRPVGRDLW